MDDAPQTVQQSFLSFVLNVLGAGGFLLVIAALASFVLVVIVIVRGRGPMAATALVLLVPAPLFLSIILALLGAISSYSKIAQSSVAPKPSELAEGFTVALIAPLAGLLLMIPALLVAIVGSFIRSLLAGPNPPVA